MATVIRVHPNGGAYGGVGGYGADAQAQNQVALAQQQLNNERGTSNLKLQYERALWGEKLKTAQLQTAVQYGSGAQGGVSPYGMASPYGLAAPFGAATGLLGAGLGAGMFGGMGGYGGQPLVAGTMPMSGQGQTNVTNQSATGAANQSVTNNNSYSTTSSMIPQWASPFGATPYGSPYGGYGYQNQGGSWLGNLFRGLF